MSTVATRPEYKVTQVGVFKGQVLPDKFLEVMHKNRPSCVGFAVVDDSEGKPEMAVVRAPSSELGDWMTAVKEARAGFAGKDMIFAFGEYPEGFKEANIQPIPLVLGDGGKPLVVATIEGLKASKSTPDGESDALHLVESYLGPKFAEQYHKAGNDPEKFEGLINGEQFKGELAWLDATMTIMTLKGTLLHFTSDKKGADFDWGYSTDTFGYTEGIIELEKTKVEEKVPAKPQGLLDRMKPGQAVNSAGKAAPAATKAHPEGGTVEIDVTKYKRGDKLPAGYEWASPPMGKDNKLKREWYVAHDITGKSIVPPDYKNAPPVIVRTSNTKLKEALQQTTAAAPAVGTKDTTVHNLPTVPPFLTHAAKDRFDKFMKKGRSSAIVDKDTKAIMAPEYIKTLENDVPSFAAETGVPWRAIYNWDDAAIKEFAGPDRTEVFLMLRDLRNFALKTEQTQFQGKLEAPADVKPVEAKKPASGLLARMAKAG